MRRLGLVTIFLVFPMVIPSVAQDRPESYYQGVHDRSNVHVVVEFFSHWAPQGPIAAGLDGAGNLRIGGAYADTTTIRTTVSADLALAFVDELLAMDFFGQPPEYRAQWGGIRTSEDGKLSLTSSEALDAGSSRITLNLGSDEHTVTLLFPAPGAPEALKDWERRFRTLINEQAGWKILRSNREQNMNEAHFILYVAEQEKSTRFYGQVFGTAPSLNVPGMTQFDLPGGSTLGLMPIASIKRLLGDTLPDPDSPTPRSELYLLVDNPTAYLQRAIDAGAVELSPVSPRDWGDDAGYCLDPDSHVLSFATGSKRP
jgi:uncharacterized glyoxalase superfamily protein PhnB